jgi:hypothetical protein
MTIMVGMHSLATLRNVSVKVLHISSTSSESESFAFQSTVSSLLEGTLLDPIIISDSVHYSFSDVLKVPSDISDHDASIMFIECPKFQIRSFQREVLLYQRTDHENLSSKLDTVDWNAKLSDSDGVRKFCIPIDGIEFA